MGEIFSTSYLPQNRDESQVSLLKNILLLPFEDVRSSTEAIALGECVRMKDLIIYRMTFRTVMMADHNIICFRTNLTQMYESFLINNKIKTSSIKC